MTYLPARARGAVRLAVASCAAITLFGAAPPSASAGDYAMRACNVPGAATTDTGPWKSEGSIYDAGGFDLSCAGAGDTFGFYGKRLAWDGAHPAVTLDVPADTAITMRRAKLWWRTWQEASGSQAFARVLANGAPVVGHRAGADLTATPTDVTLSSSTTALDLQMFCSTSASTHCYYSGNFSPILSVAGAEVTLSESVAPTASSTGGTLLTPGAKQGSQSVLYDAADADSGVERVEVRLDRTTVGVSDFAATASCPHITWNACSKTRSGSVTADTTRVSEGEHDAELVVTDAAGNTVTKTVASGVRVDNVPAPVAAVPPSVAGTAKVGATLAADPGQWTGIAGAPSYRWEVCDAVGGNCSPVPAAVGQTFRPAAEHEGRRARVAVTQRNSADETTTARSAMTGVIAKPDTGGDPNECFACRPGTDGSTTSTTNTTTTNTLANPGRDGRDGRDAPNNGTHASRLARLAVGFGSEGARALRASWSTQAVVKGRLTDELGRPIARAVVRVDARDRAAGAPNRAIGTVTTAADGSFNYRLGAGPSRVVTFSYRAHVADPKAAAEAALTVRVKASVTATVKRRVKFRARLKLSGRLARLPKAGVEVKIQALDGRLWRTIGTVKTRSRGRFAWNYRFKNRSSAGRTFKFRAAVNSPVYPFDPGTSKTLKVRVTP